MCVHVVFVDMNLFMHKVVLCGLPPPPPHQAMTEAERAPYTHRAKVEKKGASGVVREGRMDNQGELLSVSPTAHMHM